MATCGMLLGALSGKGGATHLLIRSRSWAEPAWLAPPLGVEPLPFVMEREIPRGVKARVEGVVGRI